jgi:hypothetical protein
MLNVANNARLIRLMFEDGETYNPLARKSRISPLPAARRCAPGC